MQIVDRAKSVVNAADLAQSSALEGEKAFEMRWVVVNKVRCCAGGRAAHVGGLRRRVARPMDVDGSNDGTRLECMRADQGMWMLGTRDARDVCAALCS